MRRFIFLLLFFPNIVFGQVIINEVAWMGDSESANNEWIELFNITTGNVNLDGWSLYAGDGSPTIELSGAIGPNSLFLLERTSDSSVSSVTAGLIYSGALSNSGENLILSGPGGKVDQLNFSDGWPAGDNVSKNTMQRVGNSWATDVPTPGFANNNSGVQIQTAEKVSTSVGEGKTKTAESLKDLFAYAGEDRNAVASVPITFYARASETKSGPTLEKTKYYWTFGDGSRGRGEKITKAYEFPGEYAVVLTAKSSGKSATTRIKVSVSSFGVEISNTKNGEGGFIELTNNSNREVNMGRLLLKTKESAFRLPEDTVLMGGASIKITNNVSGLMYPKSGVQIVSEKMKERISDVVLADSFENRFEPKSVEVPIIVSYEKEVRAVNPVGTTSAVVGSIERITLPKEKSLFSKAISLIKLIL